MSLASLLYHIICTSNTNFRLYWVSFSLSYFEIYVSNQHLEDRGVAFRWVQELHSIVLTYLMGFLKLRWSLICRTSPRHSRGAFTAKGIEFTLGIAVIAWSVCRFYSFVSVNRWSWYWTLFYALVDVWLIVIMCVA